MVCCRPGCVVQLVRYLVRQCIQFEFMDGMQDSRNFFCRGLGEFLVASHSLVQPYPTMTGLTCTRTPQPQPSSRHIFNLRENASPEIRKRYKFLRSILPVRTQYTLQISSIGTIAFTLSCYFLLFFFLFTHASPTASRCCTANYLVGSDPSGDSIS